VSKRGGAKYLGRTSQKTVGMGGSILARWVERQERPEKKGKQYGGSEKVSQSKKKRNFGGNVPFAHTKNQNSTSLAPLNSANMAKNAFPLLRRPMEWVREKTSIFWDNLWSCGGDTRKQRLDKTARFSQLSVSENGKRFQIKMSAFSQLWD